MALINCPECHHQVSDQAFKCTSCGKQLRKPKRTFMGKIIKWLFILFNVLMIVWMFSTFSSVGDGMNQATSQAEQAGVALGASIGVSIILTFWAIGDIVIGILVLLTRPKS